MKKNTVFILLSFALVLSFCSKKSTDSGTEEDKISIEVLVTENGVPASNLFVVIDSKVQETVKGTVEDVDNVSYESSQTDQLVTNTYGKAVFNYQDKSLPRIGGIQIEKVTIKRQNDVLIEDNEERIVKKGTTLNLEYEL